MKDLLEVDPDKRPTVSDIIHTRTTEQGQEQPPGAEIPTLAAAANSSFAVGAGARSLSDCGSATALPAPADPLPPPDSPTMTIHQRLVPLEASFLTLEMARTHSPWVDWKVRLPKVV